MSEGDEYEGVPVELIAEKVNSLIDLLDRALAALSIVGDDAPSERLRHRKEIIEACEGMGLRLPSVHVVRTPEQECALHGHTYEIVEALGHGPVAVLCSTCGDGRTVINPEQRSAVSSALSIVERFSSVWENYGGVEVKPMIERLRSIPR